MFNYKLSTIFLFKKIKTHKLPTIFLFKKRKTDHLISCLNSNFNNLRSDLQITKVMSN